ncbi:MAG: hypothetical protein HY459_01055 [Parcubacteria group bacterium]|nr:hypothetical protein [Parcubacteria group bacterium]
MDSRSVSLLRYLIEEYIESASPVGSKTLVSHYPLAISPATARHIMGELEAEGYIAQPHTSAGRIPTEKAYHFYVAELRRELKVVRFREAKRHRIEAVFSREEDEFRDTLSELARVLAEETYQTVLITPPAHLDELLMQGLKYLFSEPEFESQAEAVRLARFIDEASDVFHAFDVPFEEDVSIFIGSENPIHHGCALVVAPYRRRNTGRGMVGILGPTRMDYARNISLVRYAAELLNR